MSRKSGCKVCPNKPNPPRSGRNRNQGLPPPPPPPRSRGLCCGGGCPSERKAKRSLPPQYFPTTPGESPQWPQMRRSFPREMRQFQYNEQFFDPNRPGMQSRNLVTGLSSSIRLQRKSQPKMSIEQPIAEHPPSMIPRLRPGTATARPFPAGPPSRLSGIPQRIPPPRSAPRGAIPRVPGVALRIPVRTPETPSIQRSRQGRRRPPSAPAPQPITRSSYRCRPQSPLDTSLEEFESMEKMFQQEEDLGVRDRSRAPSGARPGYEDDSLEEFETLEEACKRSALEDLRADNVQVLGVRPTRVSHIPDATHLDVVSLNSRTPSPPAPVGGYPTSLREALTRQWQRAQATWSPETSSPGRPFPPANMNEAFIEDETIEFPPSPGLNIGFMEDDSMNFPPECDALNYGFIEEESMNFPPSPGLNEGFLEDGTYAGDESVDYVMRGNTGAYPGSPFDDTPMNMPSSMCDPNCTGSPKHRG